MTTNGFPGQEMFAEGAVTVPEAGRFTGLGRSSLYELMGRGELAYTTVGRRRLIPRRALVALLARNATAPTGVSRPE